MTPQPVTCPTCGWTGYRRYVPLDDFAASRVELHQGYGECRTCHIPVVKRTLPSRTMSADKIRRIKAELGHP